MLSPDALYPAAITSCQGEPTVPARPPALSGVLQPRTDADKAQYTSDLHDAWADCHDTVAAAAQRRAAYQVQYDAAHRKGFHITLPHRAPKAAAEPAS